jgi:hypothetical protein
VHRRAQADAQGRCDGAGSLENTPPLQAAGYGSERYLQPKSLQPPDIVALSHRHQPADLMDINSASTEQLKSLPGIAAPLCLFRHVTPLYNPAVQAASHVIVLQPIRFLCSQSRLAMPSDLYDRHD